MADPDRFSLFTEARERLGQALVRTLSGALPEAADALEQAAERAVPIGGRRELFAAAAVLRVEATPRTQRALARLYDLAFRLLEINQSASVVEGEPPLLALLGDDELDHQILVDALSNAVRERLGGAYVLAQRRIDALTRTASDDGRAPLGSGVVAAAALEAFRPYTSVPSSRGALGDAVLLRFAPRLADAIVEIDAWLAAQGVAPWAPRTAQEQAEAIGTHEVIATETAAAAPIAEAPAVAGAKPIPGALPNADAVPPIDAPAAQVADEAAEREGVARPDAPDAPGIEPPEVLSIEPRSPAPVAGPSSLAEPASESEPEPEPAHAIATSGAAPDAPMERAAEALVHATRVADVLGRQPFAAGRAESGYRHAGLLPRPEALEQDGVAFAHHVGVAPYTRPARQHFFEGLRGRMLAAHAPAAQLAALDLVAALFDYVVDDARMPAAAQPLLWRLQQPTVTLAALDAGFLGDDRRSVRRLVENLTAISIAYADDITKGSELYRRLDTVVRAVEVVAHAFQVRSSVLGEQVRREYERAAQGVAQLVSRVAKERTALESTPGRRNRRDYSRRPSREREQDVTRRLESELRDRLERCEVPESVRDFLLGVWLRHLRTALLRDGEDSSQFRLAIQVVDDLLWSLDSSGPRQSRRELAGRIPPLIRLLTQGVNDIGARPEEFRPFLDELFLIHLRKMQKVQRDGDVDRSTSRAGEAPASQDGPLSLTGPSAVDARPADAPTLDDPVSGPPAEPLVPADPLPLRPEAGRAAPPDLDPPAPQPDSRARAVSADPSPPPHASPPPTASASTSSTPAAQSARSAPTAPPKLIMPSMPPPATDRAAPTDPLAKPPAADLVDPAPESLPASATTPPEPRASSGLPRRPILPPDPQDEPSGDQRLLSVLSSLDLGDFPEHPQRLRLEPDGALERLRRGDWLELIGRDGLPQEVKVAWINSRRTVVLLVRRPDRRALSLRTAELHQRFADRKAALIVG
ncbi:MAG: DUF1631 family protein [Burkholderiaceae bacterium]|nr:DUF1631 family protein [Burkholderiales bacterium]MCZ8098816.1 DUF1631 family protein [Burkholderiales bacterium]MCZ8337093.1 DUF1631 family protein [Burkholderiaceae bacterium]